LGPDIPGSDIGTPVIDTFPELTGLNGQAKLIYWDPFGIPQQEGRDVYRRLVATFTGTASGWYGYGPLSLNENGTVMKGMKWDGTISTAGGVRSFQIPLIPLVTYDDAPIFYDQRFRGFFLQWNSNPATITKLVLD
jgi:hypothetical protein